MIPALAPAAPADMLAMLQGSSGAGAPPEEGGGPEQAPLEILRQMIDLGQEYVRVEPDAEDRATMAKLLATLHQYLAKDQSDAEAALGGGPATRLMRKLGQ